MSRIIVPRRDLILPNRHKQRGFIMNPYRFGSGGSDPHWANVISLLTFPGADGSTVFTDEKGKVWTPSGNAQIDNSLGYNAGLFDGNDRISTPDHVDWDFAYGLWTLEFLLNPSVVTGFQNIIRKGTGADYTPFTMALDGNKLRTRSAEFASGPWTVDQTSTLSVSAGSLVHVAAVRDAGNVFRQYVGGAQSGTTVMNYLLFNVGSPVHIGALSDNTAGYNGLIRGFRATKGVCRYPGGTTFTPPTSFTP